MSELPDTWTSTSLQTVANLVTGNTPSTKSPEYYGGNVPFVKPGDLDGVDPIAATEQQLTELGAQQSRLVRAGATLVSCIGNLGKVGFAGVPLATNQQINSAEFHSEIVDDRYGYYLCKTLKPWMERESSATTIAILNKGKFGKAPFLLAPLAEQKRIVDKLDSVLTRVDAVNTRLARVAPILKRFRQSVLATATSGQMTEDWREANPRTSAWADCQIGDLLREKPRNGYSPKAVDHETSVRALTLSATTKGRFRPECFKFVPDEISPDSHLWIAKGDVLIQRANSLAYVGVSAVVDVELDGYIYPDLMMKCRANERTSSAFLHLLLSSADIRRHFREHATGTAGNMPKINQQTVISAPCRVPTINEQNEIVHRVEILFAFADRFEARLQTAQTATARLTPALLAKAFRGELVPQDPNDEPASQLLRRLQQEEPSTGTKRGRRSAA